ncbi:MAG TPA: biosynthetic-type acetolactate synthase large subunit [Tissierellaceae bacterium]|nr:biosynthetic-type acetolactate synthase large subunit [Tissierellaceae bacterium]
MEKRKINGSRILLECLYRLGIRDMFGYPGGSVIPIYDEIYSFKKINHYFSRHEQGAAHEADGYARASGKVGVCLATSGPGATNLVTGIMTAHMDSIPLLVITGQVGLSMLGKDSFQESDIVGITLPITKNSYLVTDIRELPRILKESYYIATTGRPGPVLIDIPKDIQLEEIDYDEFEKCFNKELDLPGYDPTIRGHRKQIKTAINLINQAKKPLIIAGAGVLKSNSSDELIEFARKTDIPVTTTLLGLGVYPSDDELNLGMLGMHGTVTANYATAEADVIIAAGIRFDDRIAGNAEKFGANAEIIHIDIDPAEIGKNKLIDVPIVGDLKNVLENFNNSVDKLEHREWVEQLNKWKEEYPLAYEESKVGELMPQRVLESLNEIIQGNAIVATDVGQHQMWVAQYLSFNRPNTIISSGGAGTMGFGVPAAIGAQIAKADEKVVAVVGDGGFQMTYQELMMVKQYNLPIKIIIINNSYLGMVRQWQELFNDGRYSFVDLSVNPEFSKIAEAYQIEFARLETKEDIDKNLRCLIESDKATIIECIVDKEANVLPMIPSGASASDMIGKKGVIENV